MAASAADASKTSEFTGKFDTTGGGPLSIGVAEEEAVAVVCD
jgi:hypothetical protein